MNMMGHLGVTMSITAKKADILATMQQNLENHSKMVAEARDGYVKRATAELEKRLGQIKEGKIVALTFRLTVPKDYSSVYRTVIGMLQSHTGEEITMSATEYRQFVEDEWDWIRDFAGSNAPYSAIAREYAISKGVDTE
jgi:hypothetical protein